MKHLLTLSQSPNDMKNSKIKEQFFKELTKIPIIQVACEKTGISRNSVYRWRKDDQSFCQKMDQAIQEGVSFVNDMSESQLLTLIKEKNYPAISFWLRHRHDGYRQKIDIKHESGASDLTEDQKETISKTLNILKESYEN